MGFDKIRAAKNQDTIQSKSMATGNADFWIGLTGTPIQSSTLDLWAVLSGLASGVQGTAKGFIECYGTLTQANMRKLHACVFMAAVTQ